MAAKSLFQNTLPLSPLNPGTWREFSPNPMIPIDRGRGVQWQVFANPGKRESTCGEDGFDRHHLNAASDAEASGSQNKVVNQTRGTNIACESDQSLLRNTFDGVERLWINDLEIVEHNLRFAGKNLFRGGDQLRGASFPGVEELSSFL